MGELKKEKGKTGILSLPCKGQGIKLSIGFMKRDYFSDKNNGWRAHLGAWALPSIFLRDPTQTFSPSKVPFCTIITGVWIFPA